MGAPYPPIWHGDGTLELWHGDSPGTRVRIRPGRLRRWGLRRSKFATSGEVLRMYREREREPNRPQTAPQNQAHLTSPLHEGPLRPTRTWPT